ncbi:hypothetical protein [Fibrobacter sp. UWB11]|uniref:hypothetical protein n=1 Tax=Fibrobacter sp. UWB11 TaxID=1896202 RepID=UPI0009295A6C|nr:hypothetical protein [Fibrobacter sp. UWB11]SIO26777.1 hypothetical protein SAMN05720758_1855 [Fibrobacter sp. UWB11]
MNKKLYTACGAMVLSLAACTGDNGNISGTSTEPNTVAFGSSSSVGESSSGSFGLNGYDLWNPQAGDYHVNTAIYASRLPANVEADGHWFWEARGADENEGGQSSIIWPVELGSDADSLSTVIESCQGICGVANLKKGTMTMQPFAGVGFVMARDAADNPTPIDVSDWNGVCISYTSDVAASLVLDLGDSLGALFDDGFGFPAVALPKALSQVTKCFNWSQFKFPPWKKEFPDGWSREAGEKSAKQLIGLMFRIQNEPGQYKFNIKYFGTKADGVPEVENPESAGDAGVVDSSGEFILYGYDGVLWTPTKNPDRVKTSYYAENVWPENAVEDGRWYWATDEDVGGMSSVKWPVAQGAENSLTPVVESCKGVCGVASLKKGTSQTDPYVSLGFGIAKDASGEPLPVDISNWNAVCFEYYSEIPIRVELVVSDTSDGLPWAKLPSSRKTVKRCVDWGHFKLPKDSIAPYEGEINDMSDVTKMMVHGSYEASRIEEKVENAAKQTISVRLKIQDESDGDYRFGIGAINMMFLDENGAFIRDWQTEW